MAKQSDGSSIVWAFKTNVTCKNGLSWSDDNRIAMCADDGVFIVVRFFFYLNYSFT